MQTMYLRNITEQGCFPASKLRKKFDVNLWLQPPRTSSDHCGTVHLERRSSSWPVILPINMSSRSWVCLPTIFPRYCFLWLEHHRIRITAVYALVLLDL